MRFLMFYKNVLYFLITREIIELNQLFVNNTLIYIECYHFNLNKKTTADSQTDYLSCSNINFIGDIQNQIQIFLKIFNSS